MSDDETPVLTNSISDDDIKRLVTETEDLMSRGEVERAVDNLVQVLQLKPEHQQANAYLGAILLSLEQYDSAETLLLTAITASNWADVTSVMNLAKLLRIRGDFPLALRALMTSVNRTSDEIAVSDDLKLRLNIDVADTMIAAGNYSRAAEWYLMTALRFSTAERKLTAVWLQASTVYFPSQHRNNQFAETVLLQALQLPYNRDEPELIFTLGLVLYATDRLNEAIACYEQVLRLTNNQHGEALAALATSYHSGRRFVEAERYYVAASQLMQTNAVLFANYARLLHQLPGRQQEAVVVVQRAFNLDPQSAEVLQAVSELGLRIVQNSQEAPVTSTAGA